MDAVAVQAQRVGMHGDGAAIGGGNGAIEGDPQCLRGGELRIVDHRAGLAARLAQWRRDGFESIRTAWLAQAGPLGATVDVRLGDGLASGRFAGLDRDGALLLDTADGPRRIVSGELLGRTA